MCFCALQTHLKYTCSCKFRTVEGAQACIGGCSLETLVMHPLPHMAKNALAVMEPVISMQVSCQVLMHLIPTPVNRLPARVLACMHLNAQSTATQKAVMQALPSHLWVGTCQGRLQSSEAF